MRRWKITSIPFSNGTLANFFRSINNHCSGFAYDSPRAAIDFPALSLSLSLLKSLSNQLARPLLLLPFFFIYNTGNVLNIRLLYYTIFLRNANSNIRSWNARAEYESWTKKFRHGEIWRFSQLEISRDNLEFFGERIVQILLILVVEKLDIFCTISIRTIRKYSSHF